MSAVLPEAMMAEVAALLERRRTAQARTRLKVALQNYPRHPGLMLQLAWANYAEGNYADARQLLDDVLSREPENTSALLLSFELLLESNKYGDAEQIIVQLLRGRPDNAHYYGRYADLLIRAMQLSKARAVALEGLKSEPDNLGCLAAITMCDVIEQPAGATSHALQQLVVRYPQSLHTLVLVALALQDRGDYRGALNIAQELVRADPSKPDFVALVIELKTVTHWSMIPLWPMRRWGWGGAIAVWIVGITGTRALAQIDPVASAILSLCFAIYVVYSWVAPPLLRRWIARA